MKKYDFGEKRRVKGKTVICQETGKFREKFWITQQVIVLIKIFQGWEIRNIGLKQKNKIFKSEELSCEKFRVIGSSIICWNLSKISSN